MTKHCTSCNQDLPLASFNKKGDKHQGKCRECQKSWYKAYYETNPKEKSRLLESNRERRDSLKTMIQGLKTGPCMDCKETYPYYVMDFDHQSDKMFNISTAVRQNQSTELILAEIAKCELVCANCHRERTHGHLLDDLDEL